jgi:hypothetical protein
MNDDGYVYNYSRNKFSKCFQFSEYLLFCILYNLKMMSTPVHMRELCLRFELLYL